MNLSGKSSVFVNAFCDESITYTPQGNVAKTVSASVDRSPVRVTEHGTKKTAQGIVEIWIANDATLGVTTIKERFDTVTLPEKLGGADKTYTVNKILPDSDVCMWKLECGA